MVLVPLLTPIRLNLYRYCSQWVMTEQDESPTSTGPLALSLFVEIMDLAIASVSSHAVTDVRRIAKRHLKKRQDSGERTGNEGITVLKPSKKILPKEDCEELLSLPLQAHKFFVLWEKNSNIFEQSRLEALATLAPHRVIKTRDFLQAVVQPVVAALEDSRSTTKNEHNMHPTKNHLKRTTSYAWEKSQRDRILHFVGDENEKSECVYMIISDSHFKRIAVVFRGSTTAKDWMQDFQLVMSSIPNPLLKSLGSNERSEEKPLIPDTVGIHFGFRDYLYGKASATSTEAKAWSKVPTPGRLMSHLPRIPVVRFPGGSIMSESSANKGTPVSQNGNADPNAADNEDAFASESKLEEILTQLHTLKQEHPDYRIAFTGHSLGGALALMTALEVAADPILSTVIGCDGDEDVQDRPAPVTCITFGNPRVGDQQFVNAIQQLEDQRKLHCLCIHNYGDIVPAVQTNPMQLVNNTKGFLHVGFRALLYGKGRFELGRADAASPLLQQKQRSRSDRAASGAAHPIWKAVFGRKSSTVEEEDSAPHVPEGESAWTEKTPPSSSKTGDETNTSSMLPEAISHLQQQRINLHDYREYVERLLELQPVFNDLSMNALYEGS